MAELRGMVIYLVNSIGMCQNSKVMLCHRVIQTQNNGQNRRYCLFFHLQLIGFVLMFAFRIYSINKLYTERSFYQ